MTARDLHVVTAPALEPLFERFSDAIEADPLDPLQRETVVIARNAGLRAWLTQALARRLGCAAALDLPAPVSLVMRYAGLTMDTQPYEAGPLAWRLQPVLDAIRDGETVDPVYAPLRAYLDKTGGQTMPLARRVAALFDDYQTYRPHVLQEWERGRDPVSDFSHGAWQAELWRTLRQDGLPDLASQFVALEERLNRADPGLGLPPRVSVFGGLVSPPAHLRILAGMARHRPVTFYTVTPGDHPRTDPHEHPLLRALAGRTRDYWHVMAEIGAPLPKRLSWSSSRTGGGAALGAGLSIEVGPGDPPGRPYREGEVEPPSRPGASTSPPAVIPAEAGIQSGERGATHALDSRLRGEASHERMGPTSRTQSESPPSRTRPDLEDASALHQLQAALAGDVVPTPVPLDRADRSIRVHDCHSPRRELEALRDSLLDAFAETPDLRPSDVLVMAPDLEVYAPLVDAVFGAEDAADGLRLPVHVVHHPHAPALRVVEAFKKALRMHDGRVTASELLDLLSYPVVRQAAGIREEEIPRLRGWVAEAGVCWGLTGERKARFGLPDDDLHTWRFGLDRLLLGVMTGASDGLVLGHAPCDVAGLDGADLLGRFAEWAEALFSRLDAIDRPRTLADWPAQLLLFLDAAFSPQADEEVEAVVFLRTVIAGLGDLHDLAEAPETEISFRAVRSHLDGATASIETREPVLTGKVTVAHPLELRHAPFRVVAFLGLNDGVWPRVEAAPGFDLLAHAPQPGDASPRETEKQLFLDAVLSARDRLILSYVGRSQKDNAERAASVCLDAFLDAARQHWGDDARHLVVRHRLQPFADDYFRVLDGSGLEADSVPLEVGGDGAPVLASSTSRFEAAPLRPSYAGQHRVKYTTSTPPAPFLDGSPLPTPEASDGTPELTLAELADAWAHPSRYTVRQRLRASLDLDDDAVRDDEPVTMNGLEQWRVRQALLDALLDGLEGDDLEQRLLREGVLPGGAPGA
ncbi:exodeoxyribonuclease V subunit gamma, partial [Rubrivirga sp.]|uniref:exodeoxyribonuclease V subunit gamma n=1 Tax=Rubrivirga sp. TaxID=1885344 RepID=UPI003C709F8A